jgi:Ca2+/Na+ antiporter
MAAIVIENTRTHAAFALIFTVLMAAVIFYGREKKNIAAGALLALACAVFINLSVYYGVRALDHHGLSRVEFKQAALWYRDHAAPGDKMLISETNVPMYYSGFGLDRFAVSFFVQGKTIEELVPELKAMKVTYVFVDDFYIRRLPIKDPNAIDRRAWIFKEIRDSGVQSGHFTLVKTFHTKGGITSYLYKFVP